MVTSKAENVLAALSDVLETTGAKVERNSVVPEKIPHAGLLIIRDGDPGEADEALGGYGGVFYSHTIEVEVYIERGYANARDQDFDTLLQSIGTVLENNSTLDGLLFGLTYARPSTSTEPVLGAATLKTALLQITAEYQTETPLG